MPRSLEIVVAIGQAGDLERAIAVAHDIADRDVRDVAVRQRRGAEAATQLSSARETEGSAEPGGCQ
jgi:hypothetical protein